jgi:hypothetical protein
MFDGAEYSEHGLQPIGEKTKQGSHNQPGLSTKDPSYLEQTGTSTDVRAFRKPISTRIRDYQRQAKLQNLEGETTCQ